VIHRLHLGHLITNRRIWPVANNFPHSGQRMGFSSGSMGGGAVDVMMLSTIAISL
jgi:hypothetical protein